MTIKISRTDTIKENTIIHIINGRYAVYIIKDCVTKDLISYLPIPYHKPEIKRLSPDMTYNDLYPISSHRIMFDIINTLTFSNLPFTIGNYATDSDAIYQIIGACDSDILITHPKNLKYLDNIPIKLKNLITDEIITKPLKAIHIEKKDDAFNEDLVHLIDAKNPLVKVYLKAAYQYSKDFRQKIDNAQKAITRKEL